MTVTELLESGEFDWDDPEHRAAYLKAWARGDETLREMPKPEEPVA